jgi:hypothetical protein
MAEITGGCLCGAVRYTTEGDLLSAGICHCRDCRKFTGSAFATLLMVPKTAFAVTGAVKTHTGTGGSGLPILRHFCPECGSSLAGEPGTRPGMVILNVGTFDDPSAVTPALEIFRDDALPFVQITGDHPRFAKRPG